MKLSVGHVLGVPLLLTDYERLAALCREWAQSGKPVSLEFTNTHIVTMRRHELWFKEVTDSYDFFLPDGMPLIWVLNFKGAGLRDRVYGPTFMKKFLTEQKGGLTHYLLGGSEECGRRLKEIFGRLNPEAKFVGSNHAKCNGDGTLEGAAEREVVEEINRLSPDFIWVGLGTPKQQAWIHRHKPQIKRGVLMGVGFAFDANAGMKPDAPLWMQRWGLTWVHRLASEPKRLGPRYFKYNFLYLFYLVRDKVFGRPGGEG